VATVVNGPDEQQRIAVGIGTRGPAALISTRAGLVDDDRRFIHSDPLRDKTCDCIRARAGGRHDQAMGLAG
jgi:hypothetical protein